MRKDADMTFLGFGTMNGKDGKPFKTRSGGVMRLEHLIADIQDAVLSKITENRSMQEDEAKETARIVGLAALKYGDLSNQASKDYVFDIDRFSSFEGNTGPYILYTIVRIKSILSKYKETGNTLDNQTVNSALSASEKIFSLYCLNLQMLWRQLTWRKHRIRYVSMYMKCQMCLTDSIMIQRYLQRLIQRSRKATLRLFLLQRKFWNSA